MGSKAWRVVLPCIPWGQLVAVGGSTGECGLEGVKTWESAIVRDQGKFVKKNKGKHIIKRNSGNLKMK